MSKLGISTGINPNDGLGDSLLVGAIKINSNFNEIYSAIGNGVDITNTIGYALTAGIATFAGISSQVSSTININTSGIITASRIVSGGPSSFTDDLVVGGDLIVSGILTIGSASVTIDGNNNTINVGSGVTIDGNLGIIRATEFYADGVQVGVITAESIIYEGTILENLWSTNNSGITTSSNVGIGTTNASSKLTIVGNASISGVTTTDSLSIGSTQVISSERQLQNITSLDSITTETIETAISNAPNTFTDLNITGITTLSTTTISNLTVSGVTTSTGGFVGNLQGNVTGIATTAINANNLDDQSPSYYLNYDNFTNTPTNLSDFSNNVGFTTETYVNNLVAISTFSGNYNELTNTPTNLSDFSNNVGFATETYVNIAVANLVNSAPETLDTLQELAAALGDDPNFATTITNELSNKANLSGASFSGIVTATSFVGNLTGIASLATYTSEWTLGAVGSSDYTFTGPGFTGAESDPVLYLVRGQQYKFTNTMGQHPFRIQSTVNGSAGTQYDDGIVNNNVSNGTLTWNVQFDAPGLLYYQCTAHGGMGGKIYIIDAGVGPDISINTTGIITANKYYGDGSSLSGIVTSITAGSGISVNQSTGNVTISATGGDGATVTISDTEPVSPAEGNLWYDSTISRGFIYYVDQDSSQWVDFSPSGGGSVGGGESYWVETSAGIHTLSKVGIGTTNPTSALTVKGNTSLETLSVSGVSTFSGNCKLIGITEFKGAVYENILNSYGDVLTPSSGTLTIPVSDSSILVGTLGSSITTWEFTGVSTSNGSSITFTLIINSNSLYSYGDSCSVNGNAISGGIRWSGGIPPVSTNNEDMLSFSINTDNSGETRVYGSYQLNYS